MRTPSFPALCLRTLLAFNHGVAFYQRSTPRNVAPRIPATRDGGDATIVTTSSHSSSPRVKSQGDPNTIQTGFGFLCPFFPLERDHHGFIPMHDDRTKFDASSNAFLVHTRKILDVPFQVLGRWN